MIEIANIEHSPIVEMRVNNKITQKDMQEVEAFFENKVSEQESVNMLLLMEEWEGMTMKGFLEDFKLLKQIKKMNKVAVVADSKFLKEDAKIEDLLPGIRIAYFKTKEKAAAKKWLEA